MATASQYTLEPIRVSAEFTLYRARQHGNPSPLLSVAPAAEPPPPQTLRRLEHEYSLAAELDAAWAAKPLALTRHEGRTILVLADPGGEPLDRVLERGRDQPFDLEHLLDAGMKRLAVLVKPGLIGPVLRFDKDGAGIPVVFLARQVSTALEEQNSLARWRQVAGEGSSTGSRPYDDHVVTIACGHLLLFEHLCERY